METPAATSGEGRPSSPAPRPRVRVYFEGRYRKLVRDLPQTVFFCPECKGRGKGCAHCGGYGKLTKDSVQELVSRVAMPRFKARRNKFHGAGREDVDVRMLGPGRPFVYEVVQPKIPRPDLAELAAEVNRRYEGRIELLDVRWCGRDRVAAVKGARQTKEYEAVIVPSPSLDPGVARTLLGRRIEVVQRTPRRVAHRRADLERRRWIEVVSCEPIDEGRWRLRLRSEHGTYIKEAISGEGGRTQPSVASLLGVTCSCSELDVVGVYDEDGGGTPPPRG